MRRGLLRRSEADERFGLRVVWGLDYNLLGGGGMDEPEFFLVEALR